MHFGSVCSGIEAASIAFAPPDWPAADQAYQQHHAACTGAGLADVIRRLGSWAVLELHLPELGIRSRRRRAGC